MIQPLLLVLTLLPAAPTAIPTAAPTSPSFFQDDEDEEKEKPDKRPEIKELLGQLKDHAGARGKKDNEAVGVIDMLLVEFDRSGLKDRASIVKGLSACFKQKRQEKDGVRQNQLFMASAVALGEMGPESAKELTTWIGHKTHRKDLPLQRQLILALGKTRSEKAIKTLVNLITDKSPVVQGATAEALANYVHLKSKARKDIFEELLKTLTSVRNNVDSDPFDTISRERYDTIAASMITTLQVLSGHDERDPTKWQRWWNKNKRRDWDKED